jgi:hypothetical protein
MQIIPQKVRCSIYAMPPLHIASLRLPVDTASIGDVTATRRHLKPTQNSADGLTAYAR